ncbi:MAG TPA: amidase family protein [Ilumatobacteraceae bacterium]
MTDAGLHLRECIDRTTALPEDARIALLARRDDEALADADADAAPTGPLAGRVLTVKACFDVSGWVTHAGSRVLADDAPAAVDAPIVAALRGAGAVLLAQTNMTEFAYGALGLNDTFGSPTTPLMPGGEHVSGGSTSGGAVSVALGFADIALGSDTSGSIRIPAAFCGVAGFKPTQGRYPAEGMLNLARTFDTPGVIASSAAACRDVDAALTKREPRDIALRGTHFAVPRIVATEDIDPSIRAAFSEWLDALRAAGAVITEVELADIDQAASATRDGSIIAVEAYVLHRTRLATDAARYDPRVGPRILAGADVPAHVYAAALQRIAECKARHDEAMREFDAMLMPTTPGQPPAIRDLGDNAAYLAANSHSFRFTEIANRLELPSLSLPGDLARRRPYGLMITGRRGDDEHVLDLAVAVERALNRSAQVP